MILVAAADLVPVCTALRDDPELRFTALVDVVGVDFLPRVAALRGELQPRGDDGPCERRRGCASRCRRTATTPHVPSVTGVWPSAGFLEREVWDLLGVVFDGHPDLRRLLTPDDWEGHPLRKDYPVQVEHAR